MGLRLVPLAQPSHTSSRQWWSDCRLIWSQNSVAPQYCKMNPAPSLLKTAREMKAVDRLPIPWNSPLMTDALVRDIQPQWAQVLSGPLHLSVKMTFISKTKNFWPAERWACPQCIDMVGPGVCVYLFMWMSDGHDGEEVCAGWVCLLAVEALEPLGTWLYKQLWKETLRKKTSVWEVNHKEWKTNPHRDMKMHHLAKHLKLFLISSVLSQRVTSYNYIAW